MLGITYFLIQCDISILQITSENHYGKWYENALTLKVMCKRLSNLFIEKMVYKRSCLQVWISIWWYELFGVSLPILHSYVFDIQSVRNIPWYKRIIDKILQTLITEWNEKCALFLFVFDVGPILCKNMKNDVFNNNQTERINKRIGIII